MESAAEDFDRLIYIQMELYTVLYRDITNFNFKKTQSEVVSTYFPLNLLYIK